MVTRLNLITIHVSMLNFDIIARNQKELLDKRQCLTSDNKLLEIRSLSVVPQKFFNKTLMLPLMYYLKREIHSDEYSDSRFDKMRETIDAIYDYMK